MKVEVGKYTIYEDGCNNCWITEKKIVEKGKFAGNETEVRVSGYCRSLKYALEDMYQNKVYGSDATTLQETIEVIENAKNELMDIIGSFANNRIDWKEK